MPKTLHGWSWSKKLFSVVKHKYFTLLKIVSCGYRRWLSENMLLITIAQLCQGGQFNYISNYAVYFVSIVLVWIYISPFKFVSWGLSEERKGCGGVAQATHCNPLIVVRSNSFCIIVCKLFFFDSKKKKIMYNMEVMLFCTPSIFSSCFVFYFFVL